MVAVPVTKLDQLGGLLAGRGIKVEVWLGVQERLVGNGGGLGQGVLAEEENCQRAEFPDTRGQSARGYALTPRWARFVVRIYFPFSLVKI